MTNQFSLGIAAAFATGLLFSVVTTYEGVLGRAIGAVNASSLEHLFSGGIGAVLLAGMLIFRRLEWSTVKPSLPLATILGGLVFIAVAGIAYALPKTGVASGNFVMVFAQISGAVAIDALGWGGYEKIPVTLPRLLGLAFMAVGVYFILSKN